MKLYDMIKKERPDLNDELDMSSINQETFIIDEHTVVTTWTKKKKLFVSFVTLFLLWGIWSVGNNLGFTQVTIRERHIPFSIDQTKITLTNESMAVSGDVPFQTVVVSDEVTREEFGTEILDSNKKATGQVVFFNEYSKNPVTLKAGAILIGDNGNKYILNQGLKIPGFTEKNKVKKPGSSDNAVITASSFGPDYNMQGSNFTISNYLGAQRTQIYARSVGAIDGGQNDGFHKVSDKDKDRVISSLKGDLIERLKRQTRTQIPDEYVIFPNLQFIFTNDSDIQLFGPGIRFPVKVKGTLVTYIIKRDLLEGALAFNAISDHSYASVNIPDLGGMEVNPISAAPINPKEVPDTFDIGVSGQGTIVTEISPIKIKEALLGKSTQSFGAIIGQFPEIDQASFKAFPFWINSFSTKQDKIKLIIN